MKKLLFTKNVQLLNRSLSRSFQLLLAVVVLLGASSCFKLDTASDKGDSTTGDTTVASGEANLNNTTTTAGSDASVIATPDNTRNDIVENPGAPGLGDGACFLELSKPESESGPWALLFSKGCPQFAEVCAFRRPLEEVPEPDPTIPVTEEDEADQFEPFEEECARKTTTDAQGITKWAFRLPGDFYTGDIVAEIIVGQVITFTVKPGVRQEDVEPNDPSINEDDREDSEPTA